ncbi:YetF domain-containing protein [Fulvimarina sp. MAC8]|uniref:DUF421 domain-containing protein n=1 Tax=Fulvimarina sp. MAC8 TaxID=3162874 RepID=UPI0032EDC076
MFGLSDYPDAILRGLLLGTIGLAFIICIVRLIGLRSFSKMTAFDFVITLATGSLLASAGTVSEWPNFLQALVAIATLMGLQVVSAIYRRANGGTKSAIENEPLTLMRDGLFLEDSLRSGRVSRDDVLAKLRAANVLSLSEVRAVVLETTGDISVMHGDHLDDDLIRGVRLKP